MRVALGVLALLTWLAGSSPARGEIYRWVDERGVVHLDDTLANIPETARTDAKVFQARTAPPAASTNGPVQAAFANGVARELGLMTSDTQDAVSVLHLVGVYPNMGWNPTASLTSAVVDEVTRATRAAARARRLPQGEASAEAAVLRVASTLGVAGPPPQAPAPPPVVEAPPVVVSPNIVVEAPPPTVVVRTVEREPPRYLAPWTFGSAVGGEVLFTPTFRGSAPPQPQGPIPDRIPPLTDPVGRLNGPLVQPLPGIQPFRRPPAF